MSRHLVRLGVFLGCAVLAAQVPARADPSMDLVSEEAGRLAESGQRAEAAGLYRVYLVSSTLSPRQELTASLALISLLLDRAQDERAGKAEYHAEANILLTRAEILARDLSDYIDLAEILRLRWLMRFQQDSLVGSEALLRQALTYLEKGNATEKQKAPVYTELSYTLILAGEFESAIGYLRKNVTRSLEENDKEQLILDLYVIGDAYLKLGETAVSKRYFLQGIEPLGGDKTVDFYDALIKLSTIARIEGDAQGALDGHSEALAYFERTGGYRLIPAQIEIARDLLKLARPDEARSYAEAAALNPRAFIEQEIDAHLVLLELDLRQDRGDEFTQRVTRLEALFRERFAQTGTEFAHPLRQIDFAKLGVEFFARRDDIQAVETFGDRGLRVFRHVAQGLNPFGSIHLAWTSRAEPFLSQYIAALFDHQPNRILGVLESTYSDSLMRSSLDSAAIDAAPASDLDRLDIYLSAESEVVDAQTKYQLDPSPVSLQALDRALALRDQARDRYLLTDFGGQDAGSAPGEGDTEADSITIPPGHLLLRYYSNDELSFVLAKDHAAEHFYRLPHRSDLEKMVDRAILSIQADGKRARNGVLTELADILPLDLLNASKYSRVLLIPDETTHQVPFSAINISPVGRPYAPLSSHLEVVRTASARAYFASHDRGRVPAERPMVVIFADPVFQVAGVESAASAEFRDWAETLNRLPFTAEEARQITALYPSGAVATFLGNRATRENLMSRRARTARVLHIATHGYFNPATPDIVGIATSSVDEMGLEERGFLSLSEFLSRPFHSNLVVISGCETMLGRRFPGLGVQSLTQGLISQGAGAVLGTLWKVPDRATSQFMHRFYMELLALDGNSVQALARTQRLMMEQSDYSDPAFWGAFALTSAGMDIDQNVFR